MLYDILRETPAFKELTKESRLEGREEGKLDALREMLLTIVQARFPKMLRLTKGLAVITEDPEILQSLVLKLSTAQTLEEARRYLLEVGEENSN